MKKREGDLSSPREDRVFEARLNRRWEELEKLYNSLYPDSGDGFDGFVEMLRRSWKARKPQLQEQDQLREQRSEERRVGKECM